MLVLSRKVNEQIVVGKDITITIVSVDRGKVRVGVEAPRNVRIDRKEVAELIAKQQEEEEARPDAHEMGDPGA